MSLKPPILYQLCLAGMGALWLLSQSHKMPLLVRLFGLLLFVTGAAMALITKRLFTLTHTPLSPDATPKKLHIYGLYKYSRNPMYLGIALGLAGFAMLSGLWYNLNFPMVFALLMDRFFIKMEERKLHEEFGMDYKQYCQNTRRWL